MPRMPDLGRWSVVLLVVLSVVSRPAGAASIFVSPDGDEANDGSRESPRRLIKAQLEMLAAGDSLVLLPGIFSPANRGPTGLASLQFLADAVTMTADMRGEAVLDWTGDGAERPFPWQTTDRIGATNSGLVFRNGSGSTHFLYNSDCESFRVVVCEFDGVAPPARVRSSSIGSREGR